MPLNLDTKIVSQVEDARYAQGGKLEPFVRVTFMVGEHGPFVERIPKERFMAGERDAILEAYAQRVRA